MAIQPPPEWFDETDAQLVRNIHQYGYTVMVIGTGECSVPGCICEPAPYPYAYSLGMIERGLPEFVTFGLSLDTIHGVVKPAYEAAVAGRPLEVGRQHRHQLDTGATVSVLPVPDLWARRDPGRIGAWLDHYADRIGRLPEFHQIVWGDRRGNMPWDNGCDPTVAGRQPLLTADPLRYPKPPRNTARHRRRTRR